MIKMIRGTRIVKRKLFALLAAWVCLLAGCGPKPETTTGSGAETVASGSALPAVSALNVWCFQAGKADAFLFWNEGGALLLDAGESGFGKVILEKMKELGIERLDYLIVTHFDKDHVGGTKKILSEIPVGTVLQSNSPKEGAEAYEKYLAALQTCGLEPVTVRQRMELTLGDVTFTVDPPARESYAKDESNNSSLIVSVTHGEHRMLFCGDAEELRLAEFLETQPGKYDLVKLPHHGSFLDNLPALLTETKPTWAVITSSQEEPEAAETVTLLEERGIRTLLTRDGPVMIVSTPERLTADHAG